LVGLLRLLLIPQLFSKAAALQDTQDVGRAPTDPEPAIQDVTCLASLPQSVEHSSLGQLLEIAVGHSAECVRDRLKQT